MDQLKRALSAKTGIRIAWVDVTESAQELERRHLCGPAAMEPFAQALAAVSLLTTHMKHEDEALLMQLKVDGPVGGITAEILGLRHLRGYPEKKIINDLDGIPDRDPLAALGKQGVMTVHRTRPGKVLQSGTVGANPPDVRRAVARYCQDSLQTPTAVELYARAPETLERACGVTVEKLPDGDSAAFVECLERFEDGSIRAALEAGKDLQELAALMGLDDLELLDTANLSFGCRCSEERIARALISLPREDLADMAASDEPQRITCHFCGETYEVDPAQIRALLEMQDKGN